MPLIQLALKLKRERRHLNSNAYVKVKIKNPLDILQTLTLKTTLHNACLNIYTISIRKTFTKPIAAIYLKYSIRLEQPFIHLRNYIPLIFNSRKCKSLLHLKYRNVK